MKHNEKAVICLVSPPLRANFRVVPGALIYLASWLETQGISSHIIDIKRSRYKKIGLKEREEIIKEIIVRLKVINPQFVGLTCYTSDFRSVIELSRVIKGTINAKIIVGGIHATVKPKDFLFPDSPIDIVVIGEGEETLTEIICSNGNKCSLHGIRGIAFQEGGDIFITPQREFLLLDKLPMPAYDKINMQYYTVPDRKLIRFLLLSGIHISRTRGCPFSCIFCANRAQKVRYRSTDKVLEEIVFLKEKYAIDAFYICDDTFSIEKDKVFEFVNGLKKKRLNLVWAVQTRVNLITEEMLREMRRAGCIQVDLGVESGSQEALDRMRKEIKISETIRAFEICRKYKLRTYANVMFNTPGETEEDIHHTIDLMTKIKSTVYGIALTVPLIGTKIYEDFVNPKLGLDEYKIYEDDTVYHLVRDSRFRLAAHHIDLNYLYVTKFIRFYGWRYFIDITLNKIYWRKIISSKRKLDYLLEFCKSFVGQLEPVIRHLRYLLKFS